MKNLVMIVALLVSASMSAMADDIVNPANGVAVPSSNPTVATPLEAYAHLPLAELPQPLALGTHIIRSVNGPRIPAGWQLVGVEGVLTNGNSVSMWQVYLYNPNTRFTVGWLIGLN